MLELSNITLPLDAGLPDGTGAPLIFACAKKCLPKKMQATIKSVCVLRRSVDARKKRDVHFVATLGIEFESEQAQKEALTWVKQHHMQAKVHVPYEPLQTPNCSAWVHQDAFVRPVVVGTGPAGLFAALYLARCGVRPLVLERGSAIEPRVDAVESDILHQTLSSLTNIQFGEGGAGTFSDGKLTTNIKSPFASHVLHMFVEAGAPEDILVVAKPHIGTDVLRRVVRALRDEIIALGGEVLFETQLVAIHAQGGNLKSVTVRSQGSSCRDICVHQLILACGHSARDTFQMLFDAGISMEQKPFSMGVRIEHPQQLINQAQYGDYAHHPALGAADYKMAVHLPNGRSAYTFCMCPGGSVVCAASEENTVVVNGMSNRARDGYFANSALLVGVEPSDFGSDDVLAGVAFQRMWEHKAFEIAQEKGGAPYQAPAQSVLSFLGEQTVSRSFEVLGDCLGDTSKTSSLDEQADLCAIRVSENNSPARHLTTSYERGVVACDLHECLPCFVSETLEEALVAFNRKLEGFAGRDALMIGVETRSSSPVRIVRDESLQSKTCVGLYPCGEGAGYAGGIMSAASDGLRVASQLICDMKQRYA